ncbi:hypothetical protein NDU88_009339 [Pleurodeles waltl]|uniref:Receptor ligand binding region domain-containing protein n=1 Tax=Pleurodeles waltl TaxID=8319 RepID=A0AAV7P2Z2_PLEWA|nr:hypothetical protein NDU88_009339 [Pleurodeles waltl]
MVFAIEEINRSPDLLPNITLGFRIFDSCTSQIRAIQGLLEVLTGKQRQVPGYSCDPHSMPISYGSVLSTLSDKLQFPSFLRTVPSSTFQNIALARLMGHFGWTWIGMIISDDEVGMVGGQSMKRVIEQNGGCVAFMEKVHLSYPRAKILSTVKVSQRHGVKVIIVHSSEVHVKMLMEAFHSQNVTDNVFVFSASFTVTLGLFPRQTWPLFNGSLAIVLHFTNMPGFEEFLTHLHPLRDPNDKFIKRLWEKAFNCRWPEANDTQMMINIANGEGPSPCSENQTLHKMAADLFELDDLGSTYHTYLAVYALAHALDSVMSCKPGQGPFINGECADVNNIQPWQVLQYVRKINVTLNVGANLYFDANADALSAYDILNIQILGDDDIRLVKVGRYDSQEGQEVHVNTKSILWADHNQLIGRILKTPAMPPVTLTNALIMQDIVEHLMQIEYSDNAVNIQNDSDYVNKYHYTRIEGDENVKLYVPIEG